jgi:hypothetical protein
MQTAMLEPPMKSPNCFVFRKGVVFCLLGWWLKLIFKGGQGGGAYLGREGGAGGRELTRAPTTTKNELTTNTYQNMQRSAIARPVIKDR